MNNTISFSNYKKKITALVFFLFLSNQTIAFAEDFVLGNEKSKENANQMIALEDNFSSMSAAMANYYAASKGMALVGYLADNPTSLAKLTGSATNSTLVNSLSNKTQTAQELSSMLVSSGISLDMKSWSSVNDAGVDLRSKASSIDAAVISAGLTWANAMLSLKVPTLASPTTPNIDITKATSMPAEGLVFGMFMNQSLANLIGNFPDVFAQVNSTGIATEKSNLAWQKSMKIAAEASNIDLKRVVGNGLCAASFVDGLTGSSPSGCSPCAIAGMYGNAQLSLLFNPAAGSKAIDPNNPSVNITEWANLPPSQRAVIVDQNPGLAKNLDQALSGGANCSGVKGAVTQSANSAMTKVLEFLNK
jgi:hypothetical protein